MYASKRRSRRKPERPNVEERGGVSGPRKSYNVTPQSKVAAATKRAETGARKGGASEAEAKKAGKEAGRALAAKLGM